MGHFRCDNCGYEFQSRGDDSKPKRCHKCWTTRVFLIEESNAIDNGRINLEIKYNDTIQEIYYRLTKKQKINDIILELKVPLSIVLFTAYHFDDFQTLQNSIDGLRVENQIEQETAVKQKVLKVEEPPKRKEPILDWS